jgi:hypothetical protein
MRASVFGASGFLRLKIDLPLDRVQSMISRAGRHGFTPGNSASRSVALAMRRHRPGDGLPSLRAIRMKRCRVVASPKSAALSLRHSKLEAEPADRVDPGAEIFALADLIGLPVRGRPGPSRRTPTRSR